MEQVSTDDLLAWIRLFARLVAENRDALTELDAAIGDADHGANLDRGMTAAVAALEAQPAADPAAVLKTVATTLIKTVGGASGPLYGTFFLRAAGALGGDGVIAFVNGMGGTPLLELYLMYAEVVAVLEKAGVGVARNLVGSYMTSLDMAGCSVTLLRADDELLRLWDAPVRTPSLRWGA